jgi:hypothetical protein
LKPSGHGMMRGRNRDRLVREGAVAAVVCATSAEIEGGAGSVFAAETGESVEDKAGVGDKGSSRLSGSKSVGTCVVTKSEV